MRHALFFLAAIAASAADPAVISLRPDLPASEEVFTGPNDTERRIRKITCPTLTVFLPERPNGAAILVAPGGGFVHLAIDKEGVDVAPWLNTLGYTAFLLKYRVTLAGRDASMRAGVEDALLAVKTVRGRAAEWKVVPHRIGLLGFSAGGYLAVVAALSPDASARPDFVMPVYPAVPAELAVPPGAPPLFVALAHDDGPFIVEGSLRLVNAWKQAKLPAELHMYSSGGHGFGMRATGKPTDTWTARLAEWLGRLPAAK